MANKDIILKIKLICPHTGSDYTFTWTRTFCGSRMVVKGGFEDAMDEDVYRTTEEISKRDTDELYNILTDSLNAEESVKLTVIPVDASDLSICLERGLGNATISLRKYTDEDHILFPISAKDIPSNK